MWGCSSVVEGTWVQSPIVCMGGKQGRERREKIRDCGLGPQDWLEVGLAVVWPGTRVS